MNILYIIDTSGPGGAETIFIELITAIEKINHKPIVVIGGDGWLNQQLIKRGFSPHIIESRGSFNLDYLWRIIRIIKKERIDIVHAHLFGPAIYSSLAGLIINIPVISTIHGAYDISPGERFLKIKQTIINYGSSYIVLVSRTLKNQLENVLHLNTKKIKIIYNGVDISSFTFSNKHTSYSKNNKDYVFQLGSIGNIRPAKNYSLLIEAAAILVKKSLKFDLQIAGQGEGELLKSLKEQRDRLGLKDHVKFLGFCEKVDDFLDRLDLFVLSSKSEGFSIATVEAMASGVPIVSTRCGGPEEIIDDGINGCLVKSGSPIDLADAIINALYNEKKTMKMVINAQKKVSSKFSLDSMIDEYLSSYQKML